MSAPDLEHVLDPLVSRLEADAVITAAGIPIISQDDQDYQKEYEAALRPTDAGSPDDGPGVLFTPIVTSGIGAEGNTGTELDLQNSVMLAIAENPRNNTTGKSAFQWVKHVLAMVHQATLEDQQRRPVMRHPSRGAAYELLERGQGLTVYLVHLEIRTFDELTDPAPAPAP